MGMSSFASAAARAALVVKEIKINEEGPRYVHIVARKSGVIAFLLSIVGIDSTTTFDVYEDKLEFSQGSLSGYVKSCMPLSSMTVATGGFVKPFMELVIGLLLVFPGSIFTFGISAIIGIILVIRYFLSKTLLVQVVASSGWDATICLKRSVIEGVEINQAAADKIVDIIKNLVMAKTAG
mgnify:CR=1 FL=1